MSPRARRAPGRPSAAPVRRPRPVRRAARPRRTRARVPFHVYARRGSSLREDGSRNHLTRTRDSPRTPAVTTTRCGCDIRQAERPRHRHTGVTRVDHESSGSDPTPAYARRVTCHRPHASVCIRRRRRETMATDPGTAVRTLDGRCECRAVRYRVADEFYAANCHCSNCRASTGSAFKPFAGIEREGSKRVAVEGGDALSVGRRGRRNRRRVRHLRLAALLGGSRRRLRPRRHGLAGRRAVRRASTSSPGRRRRGTRSPTSCSSRTSTEALSGRRPGAT